MEEAVSRRQVEVEEMDGQLQEMYANRLMESIKEIRSENQEIIDRNREELDTSYQKKVRSDFHYQTRSQIGKAASPVISVLLICFHIIFIYYYI